MSKNYYRKIVVDGKEYDWVYRNNYEWRSSIQIFEIYYVKHNVRTWKKDVRKRKMLKDIELSYRLSSISVTPGLVSQLIRYGHILSKTEIRKYKLKKIQSLN